MAIIERFEPAMYPLAVNEFIIQHGGEPPERVLRSLPPGVGCVADIYPIIDSLYRLSQAEAHSGQEPHAVPAAKAAAKKYLDVIGKISTDQAKGGPAYPSMFSWDTRGKGFRGGIGSDSDIMRSYFDADGSRRLLGVDLVEKEEGFHPSWISDGALPKADITYTVGVKLQDDENNGVITCPICKFSQNYRLDSQGSRNAARARMSKHLRRPQKEVDAHRALYTLEFGTTDATRAVAQEK